MDLLSISARARAAGRTLAELPGARRSQLLRAFAARLETPAAVADVVEANGADVAAAERDAREDSGAAPLLARLRLSGAKLAGLCAGLRQLAEQRDDVGRVEVRRELDRGLILERVRCPLGVLGVVFESRPDALVQIVGLAVRSGNAVILKGGKEALGTNRALTRLLQNELAAQGLPAELVVLLEDRAAVDALISLERGVDLVVARGGHAFVRHVRALARVPVVSHAEGVCHLFLHGSANPAMAASLAVDAKCSYPAACNSIEALLWEPAAGEALDACIDALQAAGVEVRADEATRARHPQRGLKPATADDWGTEYGDLILAVRCVTDLDAGLEHIARHGSRHTEAIVAEDAAEAERFLREVDAASVFHNASTRFADGYRFGLGAEVGISTDKLHARGPVGVEGLLTYRWLLRGEGQLSAAYGPEGKRFTHRELPIDAADVPDSTL